MIATAVVLAKFFSYWCTHNSNNLSTIYACAMLEKSSVKAMLLIIL